MTDTPAPIGVSNSGRVKGYIWDVALSQNEEQRSIPKWLLSTEDDHSLHSHKPCDSKETASWVKGISPSVSCSKLKPLARNSTCSYGPARHLCDLPAVRLCSRHIQLQTRARNEKNNSLTGNPAQE